MQRPIVRRLAVLVVVLAATLSACSPRRKDFSVDAAHAELARAFGREPRAIQVLGDGKGAEPDTWIVDFRIDGFEPFMQAMYVGREHQWQLDKVRERPTGPNETEWQPIGALLGRLRGATLERAAETERILRELAEFIERYAVEHGNKYPATTLEGMKRLVTGSGYLDAARWRYDSDGWGNAISYHAAPDGVSYILVSPGADGRFDIPLETYHANTDQGMEIYGGTTNDPDKDFVYASGAFVQRYGG